MALNKYIAVKICGNPDSNSGFTPIFYSTARHFPSKTNSMLDLTTVLSFIQ